MSKLEDAVLKSVYESGIHQDNPKVLKKFWKDGIDINEPSGYLLNFSRKLLENTRPAEAILTKQVETLRGALEEINLRSCCHDGLKDGSNAYKDSLEFVKWQSFEALKDTA